MSQVLYDVTHTSHCHANTGIQRVTRRLLAEWRESVPVQPVVYDHLAATWRIPDAKEMALAKFSNIRKPGEKRGASWTWWQRTRGKLARMSLANVAEISGVQKGFITCELFGPKITAGVLETMKRRVEGPMVAVFHDMIALEKPEISPSKTVMFYEDYLERLLRFDIIAANSEYSRDVLVNYWKKKKVAQSPEVIAMPLGVDIPNSQIPGNHAHKAGDPDGNKPPLILCVGTLEGRKNHISLLSACEKLWEQGLQFRLRLIGMLNTETGTQAANEVQRLRNEGFPIEWNSGASDHDLAAAYGECKFTVYPSLIEGFGLPVLESIAHGRPCVCSGLTAMAEIARDGGCLAVGEPSAENLASGIARLLGDSPLYEKFFQEAATRKIRTWSDYATAICGLFEKREQGL
ncbi:hypothetical protein CKA38_03425 [Ereboglobus luteus]|uniref:Glycosyl transferase family 1 domain-containing protein n=2 Tax=Ereboglobus luteus TaxID=1796921 RepID=A0A2U8E0Q9_9BACT|nr:hypothetical protein CKA38_03425 [Ereboglobus luteus]